MIRQLLVGVARALFAASVLTMMTAMGLGYLAYRVVRFAVRGDKPYPVRDAAFGAMVAAVALAKAVQAEQKRKGSSRSRPGPGPVPTGDYVSDEWGDDSGE